MSKKNFSILLFLSFLVFLILPVYSISRFSPSYIRFLFLAYSLFFVCFYYVSQRWQKIFRDLRLETEYLQEKKNLCDIELVHALRVRQALAKRIVDFQNLGKFSENLNTVLDLDGMSEKVARETAFLFGLKGNVLLYLVNEKNHRLGLRANVKENSDIKIKEKMGDVFDKWVIRHNQPLLVEDTSSDFRFDPDVVQKELSRTVGSLIAAPLTTETSPLGILRVESGSPHAFHSDDLRFLSIVAGISKLALENILYLRHMEELSMKDGLTGVYLRRYALERLKEEFLRLVREESVLSFLMIDIDYFKKINDRFGHMAGDVVLKKLAKLLGETFDLPGAVTARYGGEEFCVMLPHISKQEAIKLAESFCSEVRNKEIVMRREKVKITVSVGVAGFPEDVLDKQELIARSDEALLRAKREGRDRVCF